MLDRLRLGDAAFRHMTRAAAMGVLALLSAVIISLIIGSLPAIRTFGFGFLLSQNWNPVTDQFGALPAIYGAIITSFIAMLIAVPVGLMIAFFLTELCPQWLRRPIGIAIELLAGIPSIIYGIWGLFVFAPFLQETLQPFLIDTLGNVPGRLHVSRRADRVRRYEQNVHFAAGSAHPRLYHRPVRVIGNSQVNSQ
jgi:phosphate transport system permease protein